MAASSHGRNNCKKPPFVRSAHVVLIEGNTQHYYCYVIAMCNFTIRHVLTIHVLTLLWAVISCILCTTFITNMIFYVVLVFLQCPMFTELQCVFSLYAMHLLHTLALFWVLIRYTLVQLYLLSQFSMFC
jgi:hypothetical protein